MAAHNAGPYLNVAIESVLKQTNQDFELLVVDDASMDETQAILQQISDPRIKVIRNCEKKGPAGSRNQALAVAKGNYVAIMDADDISLPHRFEMQVEYLEKNPDYALVGSFAYQVDELGIYQKIIAPQTDNQKIRNILLIGNNFIHGSVMIRRSVLLEVGGYDERYAYSHDYDLWLRIIERYKVSNLPEPLYCWRSSPTQISSLKKNEQDYFAKLARQKAVERLNAFNIKEYIYNPSEKRNTKCKTTDSKFFKETADTGTSNYFNTHEPKEFAGKQNVLVEEHRCVGRVNIAEDNACLIGDLGMCYTFCIITNGRRPHKLQQELDSIHRLKIPNYEIRIAGKLPPGMPINGFTFHPMPDAARSGKLGAMRNHLCRQSRFENLVVADDDLIFHADFYRGLIEFGNDYDMLAVRLLNPDGTRFWDWATIGGPAGHRLLDYGARDPNVYVTGGLCIIKAGVAKSVEWNEDVGPYQDEDVDFSKRLREAGYSIKFCPNATATHDDSRYTQFGDHILRLEESLTEGVALAGFYPIETKRRRWMSSVGSITISSSSLHNGGAVAFRMTCSDRTHYEKFPFEIRISGRAQRIGSYRFFQSNQSHDVVVTLPRSSSGIAINLRSESHFVPQALGINDDHRRLSVIFSDLKITFPNSGTSLEAFSAA
jgi:GT2 family glycosyltransferase